MAAVNSKQRFGMRTYANVLEAVGAVGLALSLVVLFVHRGLGTTGLIAFGTVAAGGVVLNLLLNLAGKFSPGGPPQSTSNGDRPRRISRRSSSQRSGRRSGRPRSPL